MTASAFGSLSLTILHQFKENAMVWFSIPCTGGCSWQCINCKRSARSRARMQGHLSLFRQLWGSLERVLQEAHKAKARVAIELPKSCKYWTRKDVLETLSTKEYALHQCDFHGCQFGLVSCQKRTLGMPILEPWRVTSNCTQLLVALHRRCEWNRRNGTHDGANPHAPCQGADTQITENYID